MRPLPLQPNSVASEHHAAAACCLRRQHDARYAARERRLRVGKKNERRLRRIEGVRMSDREAPTRRWSRVGLILIGILLGSVLVRPAVAQVGIGHAAWTVHIRPRVLAYGDSRWVRKATVQTGYFSCAGSAWESVLRWDRLRHEQLVEVPDSGDTRNVPVQRPAPSWRDHHRRPFQRQGFRPDRRDLPALAARTWLPASVPKCTWRAWRRREPRGTCRSRTSRSTMPWSTMPSTRTSLNACLGHNIDTGVYGANIQYTVSALKGTAS